MPISDLAELQALESWSTKKTPVKCVNIIEETHDVKTFQFVALQPQLFHFKPGQFIGMQLEIDGEKHNRSYTIASSPTRPHLLELTIKRDLLGVVSPWLHQQVKVGSELELRGPAGKFNCLDIAADKVLLISAGSGITPVMSMARFWCDQAADKNIQFVNWVRSTQDIIYRRELALMDFQHPNFQAEIVCTQPGLSENWLGRRGRFNKNLMIDIVPDLLARTIFCCGPDGFMQQVKQSLQQLDFNMANYHDETFDPGEKKKNKLKVAIAQQQPTIALGPFNLTFQKTGKTIVVEANENLLEVIEKEGIAIEFSCHAGNCGSCQVRKISGEVYTQNTAGLFAERQQKGYILTCTSRLMSDVILDL